MSKGLYQHLRQTWKNSKVLRDLHKQRLIEWRKQNTIERVEQPTRLDRARALGYKAMQGFVVVRVKVGKGGRRRQLYGRRGRKPSKAGLTRFTSTKSANWIAEEHAQKKFKNMSALNSYQVGEDGRFKWIEVILCDVNHPNIRNNPRMKWIGEGGNRRRVFYGLTSAGKKSRGLRA